MQNTMLPPTREDVIKETLNRSQAVAKECGDKYAIVTYGLAAAKIARQIQIQNFSKLFHTVRSIPHSFIIIFINR